MALALVVGGGLLLLAGVRNRSVTDVLQGETSAVADPTQTGTPDPSTLPGTGISPTSVGGYRNPFPSRFWQKGRIDQGVDFAAKSSRSPILAVGDGTVVQIGAPGWPGGGGGVVIRLDNPVEFGKNQVGHYVFYYETLSPTVHKGQRVKAGQIIAYGHPGGTGIEFGFSDGNGVPLSHATYTEGKQTEWGKLAFKWLSKLEGQ